MIKIVDSNNQVVTSVMNEGELFFYLRERERSKLWEKNAHPTWQFNVYPYQLISTLLDDIRDPSFLETAKQAYRLGRDMVCIHKGDLDRSKLYVATPDLNVRSLKREWCEAYLEAHNLSMIQEA